MSHTVMENLPLNPLLVNAILGVLIVWIVLGSALCWIASRFLRKRVISLTDGMNALNALFSGLAFSVIVVTLYVQGKQIEKTEGLMYHQNFENGFFQRLSTLQDITANIEATYLVMDDDGGHMVTEKGVRAFDAYDQLIKDSYPGGYTFRSYDGFDHYLNDGVVPAFDAYHTTLALLLKYVHDSELSRKEKEEYLNLVIRPMAFKQKVALYYHIALNDGRKNAYDSILREIEKEYLLLRDLPRFDRISPSFDYNFLRDAGIHPSRTQNSR